MIHYKEIPYGFEYGSAKVTRLHSDEKNGWVVIEIETPKLAVQVRATKTGKVRIFSSGEWTPPKEDSHA